VKKPPGSDEARRRREAAAAKRDRQVELSRRRRDAQDAARREQIARDRERRQAHAGRRRVELARLRREREVSLLDLVDRLLDGGVVVHGDITLAVADVDLIYVGLRALISSVETAQPHLGSALPERRD